MKKPFKQQTMAGGLFDGWRLVTLSKCVRPQNRDYATRGLSKRQAAFVLRAYGHANYAAYLRSELWASIRDRVLESASCACGCGRTPNQVHHRTYSEANLLGETLRGLVALRQGCHYEIEFDGERKCHLAEANQNLNERQDANTADAAPPTEEEVRLFLSGKGRKLSGERKIVVRQHLRRASRATPK